LILYYDAVLRRERYARAALVVDVNQAMNGGKGLKKHHSDLLKNI
jgi:hypothetical protein